jgi:hypothetical protein
MVVSAERPIFRKEFKSKRTKTQKFRSNRVSRLERETCKAKFNRFESPESESTTLKNQKLLVR